MTDKANQGFSSSIESWGFANDNSKEKTIANKRDAFSLEYANRLEQTQIESNDALKVIERCDYSDSFFYLDPPYFNSNQGHYKGYSESDFIRLLEKLSKIKAFLNNDYQGEYTDTFIFYVLKEYFGFILKEYGICTPVIRKNFDFREK